MTYSVKEGKYIIIIHPPELPGNDGILLQARALLSTQEPLSVDTGENNITGKFLAAEFNSKQQTLNAYSHIKTRLPQVDTSILAVHQGLTQSIWNKPEKRIIQQLKVELGGTSEVKIPIGRIDLLTATKLLEVKPRANWKSGVGQLMLYSKFYPEHKLVLCLFDRETPKNLSKIVNACSEKNIEAIFYLDLGFDYNQITNFVRVNGGSDD